MNVGRQRPERLKVLHKQHSSLHHISTMIMGVLPLHGQVFFFDSAVFIGCGGEKMIGISKMPSLLQMGCKQGQRFTLAISHSQQCHCSKNLYRAVKVNGTSLKVIFFVFYLSRKRGRFRCNFHMLPHGGSTTRCTHSDEWRSCTYTKHISSTDVYYGPLNSLRPVVGGLKERQSWCSQKTELVQISYRMCKPFFCI